MEKLELSDIQGIILNGYGSLDNARFLFLKVKNSAKAKKWLAQIAPEIATSQHWGERKTNHLTNCLNLALTAEGLKALDLDQDTLQQFPDEFLQGMSTPYRARVFGDTGESDPNKWVVGNPKKEPVHVLLMIYGRNKELLESFAAKQEKNIRLNGGLDEVFRKDTAKVMENKEHFGFHDGISQPHVEMEDFAFSGKENENIHPGDFVLGYTNQFNQMPLSPLVPKSSDPGDILLSGQGAPDSKDMGQNGSFLVFRLLEQDVVGFWEYFEKKAGVLNPHETPIDFLAAKCVGRWPSGAPLVLSQDHDDKELGMDSKRNNHFQYAKEDPQGLTCPVGSHIRRANPRNSLQANMGADATSNPDDSLTMVNRHRILRRGRSYGEYILNPLTAKNVKGERGLMFFCVNASISRQFEFVQQTWLNNDKFDGLYQGRDPIVGENDGTPQSQMVVQGEPERKVVTGLPRFVQVKGGAYFFLPSVRALKFYPNCRLPKRRAKKKSPRKAGPHEQLKRVVSKILEGGGQVFHFRGKIRIRVVERRPGGREGPVKRFEQSGRHDQKRNRGMDRRTGQSADGSGRSTGNQADHHHFHRRCRLQI